MSLVNGPDYDHVDLHSASGGDVTRHMLKDAKARADVGDLKSAINHQGTYNAYDVLYPYVQSKNGTTITSNGATFVFENDECTVDAATATTNFGLARLFWVDRYTMPEGFELGKTYHVKVSTTSSDLSIRVLQYAGGEITEDAIYTTDFDLTIKSNTEGMQIAYRADIGKTFTNAKISAQIISEKTNAELANNALQEYVPSGSTFDVWLDMPDNRIYNGYASAFEDSISDDLGFASGGTYQVIKLLGRVYIICPSYSHFFIGQRRVADGTQFWKQIDIGVQGVPARGNIASGSDFDSVTDQGVYFFGGLNETYTHAPFTGSGMLLVYKYSNNSVAQIGINTAGKQYTRRSLNGVFPGIWYTDEAGFPVRGAVPNNADLDTVKDSGIWFLESGRTYVHSPFSSDHGGIMLVFKYSNNSILQVGSRANTGLLYTRASLLGNFPADWALNGNVTNYITEHYDNTYNITCSPTITTDTNNYLASTGDTTDRKGDIQTMLSTTGVCRLGPGKFCIESGIEIPDYSALIGSGPRTVIELSDNVTAGYAVKLNSYASISGCRIVVKNSGSRTPSSSVGSVHGILFEATSNAQSGATTESRSIINNCHIMGFTGGGITCINTGATVSNNLEISDCHIWLCDAGINIPSRSEFHRITNVSVTGCYYGCIDNGGNNNFANCNFSGNTVGLLIDAYYNSVDPLYNTAHGSFVGCTFNHSGGNTGTAIRINGITAGEIFTGAQIFFGGIEITNSVGVRFVGCNFGRQTPLKIKDSTVVTFDQCTMYDADSSALTQDSTGDTALVFGGCYTRAGAVFDPVA